MIPRPGQRWVVYRGKAKKRKVIVVIDAIFRRQPYKHMSSERCRTRYWHEVYYKTEGTWAAHGGRSATIRGFLQFAKPVNAS